MSLQLSHYLCIAETWNTYNGAELPQWIDQSQYDCFICSIFQVLDQLKSPIKCYFLVKISFDNYIRYVNMNQIQNIIEGFYTFIIPLIQKYHNPQSQEVKWFKQQIGQSLSSSINSLLNIFPEINNFFEFWDEQIQVFLDQHFFEKQGQVMMIISMTTSDTYGLTPYSIIYGSMLYYYSLMNNQKVHQLRAAKNMMSANLLGMINVIEQTLKEVL